jgi:hypothetical protein
LGYGDFLDAIQNPSHESHEEMLEWVGGVFGPEAFDIEAVNQGTGGGALMSEERIGLSRSEQWRRNRILNPTLRAAGASRRWRCRT